MKKLLFILLFSLLISCSMAQTEIYPITTSSISAGLKRDSFCTRAGAITTIHFDSVATKNFSESFKSKLSESLSKELCLLLGDQVSTTELQFGLYIGNSVLSNSNLSSAFELKTDGKNVFAEVTLISVFARSYNVNIAWSSPDFTNPLDIHKADISKKQVNFYWCSDLPREEIISSLQPINIRPKTETGYKFDVKYHLKVFPDVTIYFEFSERPSKESLGQLQLEMKKFGDKFKTVFIHELDEYLGYYIISIDHDKIDFEKYSEKAFQKDINNLDFFLKQVNGNQKIKGLTQITFQ